MKVYSVLILNTDHSYGTWIPLDMGVTWLIICNCGPGGGEGLCTICIRNLSLLSSQVIKGILVYHFYWPTNALNCIKLKG